MVQQAMKGGRYNVLMLPNSAVSWRQDICRIKPAWSPVDRITWTAGVLTMCQSCRGSAIILRVGGTDRPYYSERSKQNFWGCTPVYDILGVQQLQSDIPDSVTQEYACCNISYWLCIYRPINKHYT